MHPSRKELEAERPRCPDLEAPTFSDWMREPVLGKVSNADAPRIGAAGEGSAREEREERVIPTIPKTPCEPIPHRSRRPLATTPAAPTQGRKRQGAGAPATKEAKKAKTAQGGAPIQITKEPFNLEALHDFASRRAADTTRLRGCAATLR